MDDSDGILDLAKEDIVSMPMLPGEILPPPLKEEDIITNTELEGLTIIYNESTGMSHHTTKSMESLESMLRQILVTLFVVKDVPVMVQLSSQDHGGEIISWEIRFVNVKLVYNTIPGAYNRPVPRDPAYCIKHKLTYDAQVVSDIVYIPTILKDNKQIHTTPLEINSVVIASIPIDIGGYHCVLNGATQEQALQSGIDLKLMKGLVIVHGSLYAIHVNEQLTFNQIHVYKHLVPFKDELSWVNIICRKGIGFENSYQMRIRLHKNDSITIELTTEPYKDLKFPFNIFFYMLGISDAEIVNLIISALDDPSDIRAVDQIVRRSIENSMIPETRANMPNYSSIAHHRDPTAVKQAFIQIVWKKNYANIDDPNERNALMALVEKMLDTMFLVHQTMAGVTTSQDNEPMLCRTKKAGELARIIRTLILTQLGKHPPTDRDHLKSKRFHTVGVLLARFFKRFMNNLSIAWRRDITAVLRRSGYNPLSIATIIKNTANKIASSPQFDQAIQNGVITVGNQTMANTLHTEQLAPPKSVVYTDAVRRSIAATPIQSKESDRAMLIRAVHSSIAGYNCNTTSPDTGEKVGLSKQIPVMTTITEPRSDIMIREMIAGDFNTDQNLIPWNKLNSAESERYVRIYINGDFYGVIRENPYPFLHKYRQLRRDGKIDPFISIVFDVDKKEISFYTDYGRQIRMWPIVKSNQWELDQYDDNVRESIKNGNPVDTKKNPRPKYFQWMALTRKHLDKVYKGELTLDNLVEMGILEWIAADEVINIIVADSHYRLVEHQHDETMPFTHVLIPISLFGIPSLGCTLANHSQPARQTYQSNQIKQTNTYITPAWTVLSVRNMYMQRLSQYPSTPTTADDISMPGGQSLNVEFGAYVDNEDDSLMISEDFIRRGGLGTVALSIVSAECTRSSEKFGMPDMQRTQRQPANYNLLKGATVPIGTIVTAGDVIIGKYSEMTQSIGKLKFIDHSVIYTQLSPAYVYDIRHINDKNKQVIIINICTLIEPAIGAKFSSRSGNKGVISRIVPGNELHTGIISGRKPDFIINPHSFPSRMLPGELISDWVGKMVSMTGTSMRMSPFAEISINNLVEQFKNIVTSNGNKPEFGYENPYGLEMVRNKYGDLTSPVFIGYAPRQCIQKFPSREISTRNRGPNNPITRNTQSGAKSEGGLRLGEMEMWTIQSTGAAYIGKEMTDSDAAFFMMSMCRVCGRLAVYNAKDGIYDCANCLEYADICQIPTSYGTLAVLGIADSLNISIDCFIDPYREYN